MVFSTFSLLALPAAFLPLVAARTDLDGCTRTDVSSPAGASYAWYVPGTGELCDFLDCGGGRAPPKYDVPGCPQYTGTLSYSPSYLPGYTATQAAAASTAMASASATATSSAYADDGSDDDGSDDYYYGDDGSDDYDDGDDSYDDEYDSYDDGDDSYDDDSDSYDDESDSYDEFGTDACDEDCQATYVWRTADNPTATFNPFTASAWPSGVSTYYIPIDLGSTTTWEAAIPTVVEGYTEIIPASAPASSDLPAICAFATTSGCGVSTGTISITRTSSLPSSDATATGMSTVTGVRTTSLAKSAVNATSSSASASASTAVSEGAAASMKTAVGGLGLVAAALGALAVL